MNQVQLVKVLQRISTTLLIIGSCVALALPLFAAGNLLDRIPTQVETDAKALEGLDEVDLGELSNDLVTLRRDVDALAEIPTTLAVGVSVERINRRLDSLEGRMQEFEELVSDDPLQALRTANLERELDASTLRTERLEDEVGRLYGQNGVFIGLIVTVILAQLAAMAATYFAPR